MAYKIEKPVPLSNIPASAKSKKGRKEYDEIVKKILNMPDGKSLPITCDSREQLVLVYGAIRRRSIADNLGIVCEMRGLTLYASVSRK